MKKDHLNHLTPESATLLKTRGLKGHFQESLTTTMRLALTLAKLADKSFTSHHQSLAQAADGLRLTTKSKVLYLDTRTLQQE